MAKKEEVAVQLKGVHKSYLLGKTSVPALRGIDLDIAKGAFMAVVGPSGSGKTTLLNMVGCLDRPSSGHVCIDGVRVTDQSESQRALYRRDHIGFVFQSFNLVPVLSAYENVELVLLNQGLKKQDRVSKIQTLFEAVGVQDYQHHRPDELSGGQRQRVAIARALVTAPSLVLADEPTANLDQETGQMVIQLMKKMNTTFGTTFVFSTHDDHLLASVSDVLRMIDGTLVKY